MEEATHQKRHPLFSPLTRKNPNSILSCVRARPRAKNAPPPSVRLISSEMWLQLNKFYLMVTAAAENSSAQVPSARIFCPRSRMPIISSTASPAATIDARRALAFLPHGPPARARPNKTSRILDVKYFILLRSVQDVGTPLRRYSVGGSAALGQRLRDCTAKRHGAHLAQRLWSSSSCSTANSPRAIHFLACWRRENSLHAISGTPVGNFSAYSGRN